MTVTTPAPATQHSARPAWGPGRILVRALGVLLLLGAAGLVVGAAELHDINTSEREDGYLTSQGTDLTTAGYALASDAIHLDALPEGWVFGDTRVQVTAADADDSLFVGIARPDDAAAYLEGIEHTTVSDIDTLVSEHHAGSAPTVSPMQRDIWVAQASGTGPQSVSWPRDGRWTIVAMNSDSSTGLDVSAQLQAEAPRLGEVTTAVFATGAVFAVAGSLLLWRSLRRRHRAA